MPVRHLKSTRIAVILPIGDTVSDHHAPEWWQKCLRIVSIRLNVVIHEVHEVRNVDAGVRLARDVQVVGLELGEFFVPTEHSIQVILRCVVVSEVKANILLIREVRVTNTGWLFDVEHIGLRVPALWVGTRPVLVSVLPQEWAVLLHEAEHRRASWTAIEPED